MVSSFMDALQGDGRVQEESGDGMKETIMNIIQIGSSWLFVCVAYFFVTLVISKWWIEANDDDDDAVFLGAHIIGCFFFGVVFCMWLYGG